MLQTTTIRFLKDLAKNNNKTWFEEHRLNYEAAKNDFEALVENILKRYSRKDDDLLPLKSKECLFRINRDVRFSKDKSPYKNNMGAWLNRGGKKSIFAGYYLHCQPGQSFVGGGIWMPQPAETKKIRQEIDYSLDEFKGIVGSKKFSSIYGQLVQTGEYALVNIPKGYEKDNPAAEFLKLKSWIATRPLTDAELTSKELIKIIVDAFDALQPLIKFINRSLE
jgi:uncharacterized protein (TIGR02453 family)